MTGEEAVSYIDSFYTNQTAPGLQRIRELMEKLGNPQDGLRFVHVAGTNGKGSTCAMTESILRTAGYRSGLFTSPHIQRFHERMQVCGVPITDEELGTVTEQVRACVETMAEQPNEFEVITAVAFVYFARQKCDIVALEVGLGGEFDATNVIRTPECAVITNIGLDHTALLGNTLEEIAHAKAGIIKERGDVVIYRDSPSVERVFEETCARLDARLHRADFDGIRVRSSTISGQIFSAGGYEDLCMPLIGAHQLKNAAVVLAAVKVLQSRGWHIAESDVRGGLVRVKWPVRFEVVSRDPLFIIDGGHNPQCLEAVTESLRTLLPGRRVVFLTGVLRDKDAGSMAELLDSAAAEYVTVTPPSPRAMEAGELAELLSARSHKPAEACGNVLEGIEKAKEKASGGGVVCCVGSLYLAGEVRQYFA